jgi:O-antigen ligase
VSLVTHRPATLFMLVLAPTYCLLLTLALVWLRLGPELILALTIGAVALAIMAFRSYVSLHMFLVVLFFENVLEQTEGITPMKALGFVILAGWLANMMVERRIGVSRGPLLFAMLGFVAWAGVCVLSSVNQDMGLQQFASYLQLTLSAIMFNSAIRSRGQLRGILIAFLVWTVLASIVAVIMYYAGTTRVAVGFIGNRNTLGLYINMAVAIALLMFPTSSRLGQIGLALSLPILLLGLALTLSRSGLLIMGGTMLVVWYRLARHQGVLILLGSAASLLGLVFFLPGAFWQRVDTIVPAIERREDTWGLRLRIWQVGVRMIQDNPIMGVGPGNFIPASPRYSRGELLGRGLAAHNVFICVAAELGMVGLGGFIAILVLGLSNAHRAFRRARDDGDMELMLSAVAVELMIWILIGHGVTADVIQPKYFWVVFGLALALENLTHDPARAVVAPAGTGVQAAPEGA